MTVDADALAHALDALEDAACASEDIRAVDVERVRAALTASEAAAGGETREALEKCARAIASRRAATRANGDDADAIDAVLQALRFGGGIDAVDAMRACATRAHCAALERTRARRSEEETPAGGPREVVRAREEEAMELNEVSERAVRALERLAVGLKTSGDAEPTEVLEAAAARARATLETLPKNHTERVLDSSKWTNAQRDMIERVERALHDEYKARRRMVRTRAEVTTTSFCYSPRLNALKDVREDFARRVIEELHVAPQVTMDDVCDARYADLAMAGIKVTAGNEGLQSAVKKVMMGSVPDRGGRTDGNDRVTANMPSFAERKEAPSGGGGRGSGGGGGQKTQKKKGAVRW